MVKKKRKLGTVCYLSSAEVIVRNQHLVYNGSILTTLIIYEQYNSMWHLRIYCKLFCLLFFYACSNLK